MKYGYARVSTDDQDLAMLPSVAATLERVERDLRRKVFRLRERGVDWERIAESLGGFTGTTFHPHATPLSSSRRAIRDLPGPWRPPGGTCPPGRPSGWATCDDWAR